MSGTSLRVRRASYILFRLLEGSVRSRTNRLRYVACATSVLRGYRLWQTGSKLGRLLDAPEETVRSVSKLLGIILAHELVVPKQPRTVPSRAPWRLAGWQKRTVVDFIEEHLTENISLASWPAH